MCTVPAWLSLEHGTYMGLLLRRNGTTYEARAVRKRRGSSHSARRRAGDAVPRGAGTGFRLWRERTQRARLGPPGGAPTKHPQHGSPWVTTFTLPCVSHVRCIAHSGCGVCTLTTVCSVGCLGRRPTRQRQRATAASGVWASAGSRARGTLPGLPARRRRRAARRAPAYTLVLTAATHYIITDDSCTFKKTL